MAVVEGGRPAITRVRVREQWTAADYLEISLQTGRTHQIRVHLSHVGHPVVGDMVYGGERWKGMSGVGRGWARALAQRAERQFLHAAALAFTHPETGEAMRFRSSLPPDLEEVAAWARNQSGSQQG
jgi:23S rRNA pseudouridine1911/1915/1917 synthase